MKRNIFIVIISVLILACIFAYARTTTTDLGLGKPTWEEGLDILDDINANTDILEAFANDVLEYDLSPVLRAPLDISTFNIEGVDATEFGYLDGVTSDIQTQFGLRYLKTETDALSEWETIWSKDVIDSTELASGLGSYYLKTAIDELSEVEAIYSKDIIDSTELGAFVGQENIVTVGTIGTGVWQGTAIADGYIPNGITIDLATLATTFTCTDNESTDETLFLVFVDGATGAQGAESDGDLTYNPSTGTLTATEFAGGGGGLTDVGVGAATALTIDVKEENIGDMVKGQPVYLSGATGQAYPKVGLADADVAAKAHVIGLAAEAISQNTTGIIRVAGLLEGVDTRAGSAVNPDSEEWAANQLLYLHTTAGGLTKTEPTIGRVVEVGHSLYGNGITDAIQLHIHNVHPHIEVSSGEDIVLRLGDSGGSNKVYIKDYSNTEVAYIDSDGNIDGTALTLDTALAATEGGTGLTSLGTNVATFLGTPSSANLINAVTGETGSGALVFGTSPTFTTQLTTPVVTASAALAINSASNNDITIQPNGTGDTIIYAPSDVVTTKTAAATLTIAEAGTVLVSCAATPYTITLPTAVGHTGLRYHFIKTDANYFLITLDGNSTETFNYESSTGAPVETYARLNTYCAEVTIVSDGTNWQVINEALGQVPECWAYLSATQENLVDTIMTLVELNTESYDIGSNFNTGTHLFTVPIPGRYFVVSKIDYINGLADKLHYNYVYNGETAVIGSKFHSANTLTMGTQAIGILDLAASDTLELKARVDAGVNTVDIEGGLPYKTFLSIKLVSKD